jgi:hypothetical protein
MVTAVVHSDLGFARKTFTLYVASCLNPLSYIPCFFLIFVSVRSTERSIFPEILANFCFLWESERKPIHQTIAKQTIPDPYARRSQVWPSFITCCWTFGLFWRALTSCESWWTSRCLSHFTQISSDSDHMWSKKMLISFLAKYGLLNMDLWRYCCNRMLPKLNLFKKHSSL